MYLKNHEQYLNKKIKIIFKSNQYTTSHTEEVIGTLKYYYPPVDNSSYESCLSLRVDYIPNNHEFTYVILSSLIDRIYVYENYDKENKNCDLLLKKLPTDVVNNIKTFFKTGYYLIKN